MIYSVTNSFKVEFIGFIFIIEPAFFIELVLEEGSELFVRAVGGNGMLVKEIGQQLPFEFQTPSLFGKLVKDDFDSLFICHNGLRFVRETAMQSGLRT